MDFATKPLPFASPRRHSLTSFTNVLAPAYIAGSQPHPASGQPPLPPLCAHNLNMPGFLRNQFRNNMLLVVRRCNHAIPEELLRHLPWGSVCPCCTINHHIDIARGTIVDFARRGGSLKSKAAGRAQNEAQKPTSSREWCKHWTLVHRWRKERVALAKDVQVLEDVREERDVRRCPEAVRMIKKSLVLYRRWIMTESQPTLRYGVQLDPSGHDAGGPNPDPPKAEHDPLNGCPSGLPSPKDPLVSPNLSGIMKSCLRKAMRSNKAQRSPRTPKHVSIHESVTIVSSPPMDIEAPPEVDGLADAEDYVTLEFSFQLHNPHAYRNTARRRSKFCRTSLAYRPGPWASPAAHEKMDTSFAKLTGEDLRRFWAEGELPDEATDVRLSEKQNGQQKTTIGDGDKLVTVINRDDARTRQLLAQTKFNVTGIYGSSWTMKMIMGALGARSAWWHREI